MNINNHLNETNVAISLRVSITNHLKLVQIYLPNPVELEKYIYLFPKQVRYAGPYNSYKH